MFGCQENTRKEEKEDQVNQSHQGADHLLAETSKCLYAISRKTLCFLVPVSLCYSLMKTFGELPESSPHQTEDTTKLHAMSSMFTLVKFSVFCVLKLHHTLYVSIAPCFME